jgi:S1-C subfamily serine protease
VIVESPEFIHGEYVKFGLTTSAYCLDETVYKQVSEGIAFAGYQNSPFLVTRVVKKAMPSVVGITTERLEQDLFFGLKKIERIGTGVVVDSRGYILTNAHVVSNGNVQEVNVLFHDGNHIWYNAKWRKIFYSSKTSKIHP